MNNANEKVAVITGASSGIGFALAIKLLNEGYKIAVCSRNEERLKDAFKDVNEQQIYLQAVDVADEKAVESFISNIINKWNRIDILINNAGMSMRSLFADVKLDVLKKLMDINFWGAVYCTKFALPYIIKSQGSIVGISSVAGYRGLPARIGYSASKFALNGFLETLRSELYKKNVHIMTVAPGFTTSNIRNTSMTADGSPQKETPFDESKLMSAEQCAEKIVKGIYKRKRIITMTAQGWWTVFVNKFLPVWMDKMTYNHFKNEPNSPLRD